MWQSFEKKIRDIASYRWNCSATTETIAGVKCDCVLKPDVDQYIIIEITEESSLTRERFKTIKVTKPKYRQVNQRHENRQPSFHTG